MKEETTTKQLPSLKHLIASLNEKKSKDYTFATLFFVIFSVFIFFAIKPSLSTALDLSAQEKNLIVVDTKYELLIGQIVQIQSALEEVRDRLYLIDEALPEQPFLNVVMSDIQRSASKNNVTIKAFSVQKISLIETKKEALRSMIISVELGSSFENYVRFEKDLIQQRRLKNIKSVNIDRDTLGSGSAALQIRAEIEGYYL